MSKRRTINSRYDFTDQIALVTGDSSGMGLVTAQAFAEAGAVWFWLTSTQTPSAPQPTS